MGWGEGLARSFHLKKIPPKIPLKLKKNPNNGKTPNKNKNKSVMYRKAPIGKGEGGVFLVLT